MNINTAYSRVADRVSGLRRRIPNATIDGNMARKKTREQISLRINAVLLDRIDQYAERMGRARSEVIDHALTEFIDRHAPDTVPQPKPPKSSRK